MRSLIATLALLLVQPASASACDFGCFDGGSVSASRSVIAVAPKPAPRPAPKPTPRPQPATVAASLGLHRVTSVWAGDVVTRSGPVTTYTSVTVQQNAGTYAKQVATVTTGQKSAFDSALSNQRTTLSDGRAVSGDIYANYVWSGSTLRLDRYVFFQDDREVASQPTPAPARTPAPAPVTPAPTPGATPRPPVATPVPAQAQPVAIVTPRPAAATPRPTPTPAPRVVRAGIALAAQGDPLGRFEVLRGRRVDLWARGMVDGAPGRVTSWRLTGGEVTALGALSGTGDQPFVGTWRDLGPGGSPFTLRFDVTVEVSGEWPRHVEAAIEVVVRSPALVE